MSVSRLTGVQMVVFFYSSIPVVLFDYPEIVSVECSLSDLTVISSRNHAYIILTPLNPTFI